MESTLTPAEAEDVVDRRIQEFGLRSIPRVQVVVLESGRWQIAWDEHHRIEEPMTAAQWCDWLQQHVGSMDPERLEALEG